MTAKYRILTLALTCSCLLASAQQSTTRAGTVAEMPAPQSHNPSIVRSKISIYDLRDRSVRVIYAADVLWEAPNWSPDGKYLLANSGGKLYRFSTDVCTAALPQPVNVDPAYKCNNDHGPSADGKLLAFSAIGSIQAIASVCGQFRWVQPSPVNAESSELLPWLVT